MPTPGLQTCAAQTVGTYTDKTTGVQLRTWGFLPDANDPDSIPATAAFTFGMALPADALEKDANEYIGVLVRDKHPGGTKQVC